MSIPNFMQREVRKTVIYISIRVGRKGKATDGFFIISNAMTIH